MAITFKKKDGTKIEKPVSSIPAPVKKAPVKKKVVIASTDDLPKGWVSLVGVKVLYDDTQLAEVQTHRFNGLIEIKLIGKGMKKSRDIFTGIGMVKYLDGSPITKGSVPSA